MAHTVRYPYHGTLSGGTGTTRSQPGALSYILGGYGLGEVQGGGVVGYGSQKTQTPEQRIQQERAIAAARAKEQQANLLTRPSSAEAAKARLARDTAIRAGRPNWQNSVDVPIPAPGQRRFPPGVLMKIPGGLTTDTPPPDLTNLGQWVSSIVGQGIAQQERGGRVLVGWASVAANNGDPATASAYRGGALKIAGAYAPKKAAADAHLKKMQAEGRAPKDMNSLILASIDPSIYSNMHIRQTAVKQVAGYMAGYGFGQDAVASAQTVMAEWETLAAEDPAAGPVHTAVHTTQLARDVEADPVTPEAKADAAAKKPGMGMLGILAIGGIAAFVALR